MTSGRIANTPLCPVSQPTLEHAAGLRMFGMFTESVHACISLLLSLPSNVHAVYSVPVSKLPQLVYETKEDLSRAKLPNTTVGHVGDGNFHAFILFRENQLEEASEAVHRLVQRAINLDGTCLYCLSRTLLLRLIVMLRAGTGEHGVGVGKKEYLLDELGEGTIELMKTIKRAVDPLNLLNPGKV